MLRPHDLHGCQSALALGHLNRVDALTTTILLGVVDNRGALAVATLGHHEQLAAAVGDLHAQHLGVTLHGDAADATRVAAGGADLVLGEHDSLAGGGGHDDLVARLHAADAQQAVAVLDVDGDDAVAARTVVSGHGRLLHHAARRREHEVLVLGELAAGDDGRDLLALLKRKQVDDRGAAGLAGAHGQLMHLEAVHLAARREEQHIFMGAGDEHLVDDVVFLEAHAGDALAAALLGAVGGHRDTLHVAGVSDGHNHVLIGDEVLDVEVLLGVGDLGAALVAKLAGDLAHLLLDHAEDLLLVRKQILVVGDGAAQAVELLLDLVALQAGEAAELHLKDGRGLLGRKPKALDEARGSLGIRLRRADDGNDLVDVVEGDEVTLEDVRAGLGLLEVEAGAAGHDVDLVIDVVLQHLAQGQALGDAVDQGEVVGAEGRLQGGVLIEVVEHDLRNDALLEFDDEAQALLGRLIAHVGDALDALLVDETRDLLLQGALVHHVRDLGEHEAVAAGLGGLDVRLGAHGDGAAAGLVGLTDTIGAHDEGARGEVGAGHDLHELVDRRVGVVDEVAGRLNGLTHVVRGDVGRHADGDALAAVDQQVGEARGQGDGLGERLVVVGLPVDCVLLEVAQELHGGLGQAGLGVTHGRRAVAVDVAEVAVTVHERGAHGEPLGHADHGLVHGEVAVRVVLADNFADRPCRLLVRAVGEDATFVHRIQDTAVDGLEAVADIGQGAGGDDRHRVLDEGLLHLAAEFADLQRAAVDVSAGVLAAIVGAEALLEVLVVILFLVGLGVGVVPAVLVLRGAGEQALEVLGHALGCTLELALVVVHVVSHVFSLPVVVACVIWGRVRFCTSPGRVPSDVHLCTDV